MKRLTIDNRRLTIVKTHLRIVAFALLWSMVSCQWSNAQSVSATLRADSTQILIGDYLNVHLTVKTSNNIAVAFPTGNDTLGNLEVVSASKVDSTIDGSNKIFSQLYTISAYDSGDYHAGPIKIYFKNSAGELDSILSNDIPIRVNTLDVDTTKPFKAIKAPFNVSYSWQEFIYYIVAGIVLLLILVIAILLWRSSKKPQPIIVERPKPKTPAHIWARTELKKLEEEKIWQSHDVKLYYSRLTDILRLYVEYRYGWYAMESTTEEIQTEIENYNLKEKAKENLLAILRSADLVKFAKMIPLPDANMKAMENAKKFIDFTEPSENKTVEK